MSVDGVLWSPYHAMRTCTLDLTFLDPPAERNIQASTMATESMVRGDIIYPNQPRKHAETDACPAMERWPMRGNSSGP